MTPTRALIEAAEQVLKHLSCHCDDENDCHLSKLRAAISSAKAAEEGTMNNIPPDMSGSEGKRQINAVLNEAIEAAKNSLPPSANMTQITAVDMAIKAIRKGSR